MAFHINKTRKQWKSRSKLLRKNKTYAELKTIELFKNEIDANFTFQHPISTLDWNGEMRSFYLDFYFPNYLLGVEIDGGSHTGRYNEDLQRDLVIQRWNKILIIHFSNKMILENPKEVVNQVRICLDNREEFIKNTEKKILNKNKLLFDLNREKIRFQPKKEEREKELKRKSSPNYRESSMDRLIRLYG